jgi:hypothetical protein
LEAVVQEDPERRWLTSKELLGRLKSKGVPGFQEMNEGTFLRDFLHVMQGRGLQRRDRDDAIRLDPKVGGVILRILRSDLVKALFKPAALNDKQIEQLTSDLVIKKLWSEK